VGETLVVLCPFRPELGKGFNQPYLLRGPSLKVNSLITSEFFFAQKIPLRIYNVFKKVNLNQENTPQRIMSNEPHLGHL